MAVMPQLSIIIPVLNEAEILQQSSIQYEKGYLAQFTKDKRMEILIIDGGSQDSTVELCQSYADHLDLKVFSSPQPGRANQMNYGASLAQGEWLLFLHLDSILPEDFFAQIARILTNTNYIAGAFALTIDLPGKLYRWLEKLILWRSIYAQLPYGDQGLFIRKQDFQRLGGFADLPIMEDYQFMQKLSQQGGKVAIAEDKVITSGRRWQKLGLVRTTVINQAVVVGYHLGVCPHTLAHWYRGAKPNLGNRLNCDGTSC
ncbi:TIGR04283 family arsenosugar biosynthesis glycosyltransferase [Synechocystis sp. PCC 7339]|uniref:TIGR04283 family arsenosugar biosynthesis glycosyltransferase n=1 Tax=unclassified Synechocystis TaxID=2640012 RepID=UPI001BAFBC7E|nr:MULTISPECIES: TIGR04283 family arsenosugar biosynthesis glycosyltransferase [unclassified Synechocystis]QUS59769.1 TIGR04283 family arsenosugar biosynthesis glycosyltransferase [Synechocystis sp. PCC 7338]UAJ72773.1 TIGR04283 family arsenosugar biosynthesis glycosyltransferase [Synechocystis sp. PCC 7339]